MSGTSLTAEEAYVFARITELIGEMAWGVDLPEPMVMYFQAGLDGVRTKCAVSSENYRVIFDAIYNKLKKTPHYQPFLACQKKVDELEHELATIRERTARECAEICDEYPLRDPAGDGDGYWASGECKNQILKRFGLEGGDGD